jgi:hypothetical protein
MGCLVWTPPLHSASLGSAADSCCTTTSLFVQARPLVEWDKHTGTTTMTYFPALKKFILSISTATNYPMMTEQFDTYFLESDSITGPWSYITYMQVTPAQLHNCTTAQLHNCLTPPKKHKKTSSNARTESLFLSLSVNLKCTSEPDLSITRVHQSLTSQSRVYIKA